MRTDGNALAGEHAFQLVPHPRYRFSIRIPRRSSKQAEGDLWKLQGNTELRRARCGRRTLTAAPINGAFFFHSGMAFLPDKAWFVMIIIENLVVRVSEASLA